LTRERRARSKIDGREASKRKFPILHWSYLPDEACPGESTAPDQSANKQSIREIGHGMPESERRWTSWIEFVLFGIIVTIVSWPMLELVEAINTLAK
jgi:hypothetical protein